MKRPISAAEASAFTAFVCTPELKALIERTNDAIFTAATEGIYGCSVTTAKMEQSRMLQSFFLRLGYQVHVDNTEVQLFWTTLKQ